jgi:hypothetical protein
MSSSGNAQTRQNSYGQGRIQPIASGQLTLIISRKLQRNHCSLTLMISSPNEADPGAPDS